MAVVKGDAVTQVDDVGQRVGVVEALRQRRPDSQVVAMFEQWAVDELRHSLRRFVVAESRIERCSDRSERRR